MGKSNQTDMNRDKCHDKFCLLVPVNHIHIQNKGDMAAAVERQLTYGFLKLKGLNFSVSKFKGRC